MSKAFHPPQCPPFAGPLPVGPASPWLAPLAGYSDLPFRLLCREYGAAVCETEMISSRGLIWQSRGTAPLLASNPADQPLVVQLFGPDAQSLAGSVRMLRVRGYRFFDLNMGCSVRKVLRQKSGAALLEDMHKALQIASAMIAAAREPDVGGQRAAIGFKLRLGLAPENLCATDLALRLEDAGAAWVTLHPRFASQGFGGEADWGAIADLAARLEIPVIASGDLLSARAGLACLEETGATGLMYARGALRNPAIFSSHMALLGGGIEPAESRAALCAMIKRHIDLSRKFGGEKSAFIKMRSIIPRYVRFLPGVGRLREALCQCESWEDLSILLASFLARSD